MKKGILIGLAFIILIGTPAFWLSLEKSPSLNTDMGELATIVKNYLPIVLNKKKPLTVNQVSQLESDIDNMIRIFSKHDDHFSTRSDGMRVTQNAMFDLLVRTRKQLKEFKPEAIKGHLTGVAQMCISCHAQDRISGTFFKESAEAEFESKFEFAEYNFITRRYTQAEKLYKNFLISSGMGNTSNVEASLNKLLVIYVVIYKKAGRAIEYFTGIMKNPGLNPILKIKIGNWLKELEAWKKRDDFKVVKQFVDLQRFVAVYLDPIESGKVSNNEGEVDVTYLRLWSVLSNYLSRYAKDYEYPFLYYWMALTDEAFKPQLLLFRRGHLFK